MRDRVPSVRIIRHALLAVFLFSLLVSCSGLFGPSNEIRDFVKNGLAEVALQSYRFSQGGTERAVLASGRETTVTLDVLNPRSIQVTYGIACNLDAACFAVPPPASVQSKGNAPSFTFTLNDAAELQNVVFTIAKSNPEIKRVWDTDTITAFCDSPPSPAMNLSIGRDASHKAFLAFTLSETAADLASVTIDWQDVTAGTAPISVTLSPSDAALTTTIAPDPLALIVSATKRYFSPAIAPGHACAFIVRLTDSAGQSSAPATAGAEGVKFSLSYNVNGGSGAVPASAEYAYGTPATVAGTSGLVKSGRLFGGWNTSPGGGGAAYAAGSSIVMNQGNLTLYAQWMSTVTENGVTFTNTGGSITDSQGVKYTVTGSTIRITGNTSAAVNVVIPASIGGYPVTSIKPQAFYNCTTLTTITLPDSVTSIGSSAFQGCTALTSVAIPAGVTTIETTAFHGCTGLTAVTLPEGLTSIGHSVFTNCTGLTTITLPASLTSIGNYVFQGCTNLQTLIVNAAVPPSLGGLAFQSCPLTQIKVPSASLNAYKTAAEWKAYAAIMVGF